MESLKKFMVCPALDLFAGLFVDTNPPVACVHCPLFFEFIDKFSGRFENSETGHIGVIHLRFLSPYRISINYSNANVNSKNYLFAILFPRRNPKLLI